MATLKLPSIHFSRSAYYVRMLSIQFCDFFCCCCCLRLLHVHIQFFFGIQPYPIELFMSEQNEEKIAFSLLSKTLDNKCGMSELSGRVETGFFPKEASEACWNK